MKVLWLCNIILPELSEEFGLKKTNVGGWLSGMWKQMKQQESLELAICTPLIDSFRMKDGAKENYKYYSFHRVNDKSLLQEQVERFVQIIDDFQPDLIHIWGTEFMHSLSMTLAAEKKVY